MVTKLRFRLVILGPLSAPERVLNLGESSDGHVWLGPFCFNWPVLDRTLEAVTLDDLPVLDRTGRLTVTLLPVQVVTGKTPASAHRRMIAVLGQMERHGVRQARSA